MKQMRSFFALCLFAALISTSAFAQPRIGDKMPEFRLQATDQRFYGVNESQDNVSVLFFMGWW